MPYTIDALLHSGLDFYALLIGQDRLVCRPLPEQNMVSVFLNGVLITKTSSDVEMNYIVRSLQYMNGLVDVRSN